MKPTLEMLAAEDLDAALDHGVSLNPFSTTGGRGSWQRGFDGLPPWPHTDPEFYKRGQAARKLCDEQKIDGSKLI